MRSPIGPVVPVAMSPRTTANTASRRAAPPIAKAATKAMIEMNVKAMIESGGAVDAK